MVARVEPSRGSFLPRLFVKLWEKNRALTFTGATMLVTFAATLVGLAVDPRVITGAPAWLKPAKFAVSFSVYSFSVVWLLQFVTDRAGLARRAGNWIAVASLVEVAVITLQVLRGTTSHFNFATLADNLLYITTGIAILVLWAMNMLLVILLLRQRFTDRAWAWTLRSAILVCLFGLSVGFLMLLPQPGQLEAIAAGSPNRVIGAHSVGVADGGPGIPGVGWSTEGGDLRVPHFVGMHALQVLPLLGAAIVRRRRLTEGQRLGLVAVAAAGYFGVTALLTVQALRGQPVIAPDTVSIALFAGLLLGVVAAVAVIVRRGQPYANGFGYRRVG